jgi:hypothetical protein
MRKQKWMAVIGFCICAAAFPAVALAQAPSVPLQNAVAVSTPILAMPGEIVRGAAFASAVDYQYGNAPVTGSSSGSGGMRPHSVVIVDASSSTFLAQNTIALGITDVQYTVPMNAITPSGPGQFVVVAVIAAPLPNCPFCPPLPPPFGIFSAGATVFTPAANTTNGNATVGPTNVRSFAVAMLNPLVPFGLCPQ